VRASAPDVILVDLARGREESYAYCRALKGDAHLRFVPVVFLGAEGLDGDQRRAALAAGAEGFLARPIGPEELHAQLRALAKMRVAQHQRLEKISQDYALLHSILESPQNIIIFALDAHFRYTAFTSSAMLKNRWSRNGARICRSAI